MREFRQNIMMVFYQALCFLLLLRSPLFMVKASPAAEVLDADGELIMKVGVKVQRGPDWQYGKQDGGRQSVGIVIEIGSWRTDASTTEDTLEEKFDRVRVLWKDTGSSNVYRYGHHGKYDVVVVDKSTQVR